MSTFFKRATAGMAAVIVVLGTIAALASPNPVALMLTMPLLFVVWAPFAIALLLNVRRNWIHISGSGRVRVRSGSRRTIEEIPRRPHVLTVRRGLLGVQRFGFETASGGRIEPRVYLGGTVYFDQDQADELARRLNELGYGPD